MARNQEKAKSMFYRFREAQLVEAGLAPERRRPYLTSDCPSALAAKHYRREIVQEVSERISKIQDPALDHAQIRELNDEINKLMREKNAWEFRILQLGGKFKAYRPDEIEGSALPGDKAYRYFGRAKELPGVRELFEQQANPVVQKTRFEMIKSVDPDYYGLRDEEEELLLEEENSVEKQIIQEAFETWRMKPLADDAEMKKKIQNIEEALEHYMQNSYANPDWVTPLTHEVHVPSQQEVETYLVTQRRQELMKKYVSEDLSKAEKLTKELRGIKD